jgi:hypothetical protein
MLHSRDFALVTANRYLSSLLHNLSEMETFALGKRLYGLPINRPVFITGLARSGTTILLTLLSQADHVATHRYRDFPFLSIPVIWNWFQSRTSIKDTPVERPHGDRIHITKESPEAFEEPLWQLFFPWTHDPTRCHVLDSDAKTEEFTAFFCDHIRKMLFIRNAQRYVSKGNYNVARITLLAQLLPDARFIIPIRAPLTQVRSLVKQHQRFSQYSVADKRIPHYLAAAGHYEFGPQRCPMNLDLQRIGWIEQAWRNGEEYRGYARQWAEVYRYVDRLRQKDEALANRILILRYEDLCACPAEKIEQLFAFTALDDSQGRVHAIAETLAAPPDETLNITESDRQTVWQETASVAECFGYC